MINILIVDDSHLARKRIVQTIAKFDIEHNIVAEVSDGIEALKAYSEFPIDLIITDLEMPNMDGLELIQEIRQINTFINILVVSSIASQKIKQTLKSDRYIDFVKKPLNSKVLEILLLKLEHKLAQGVDS